MQILRFWIFRCLPSGIRGRETLQNLIGAGKGIAMRQLTADFFDECGSLRTEMLMPAQKDTAADAGQYVVQRVGYDTAP